MKLSLKRAYTIKIPLNFGFFVQCQGDNLLLKGTASMVFLTVQIFPSLWYGDEEGEDGADDGGNPEDLQGCCQAPLVGTPADKG